MIESVSDADELADFLDKRFSEIGHRVNVVVNYDNVQLNLVRWPLTASTTW